MGTDFVQKWRELQELLERQRAKGGIIDPDVESNRFLIHINEVGATRHQRGDARELVARQRRLPSISDLYVVYINGAYINSGGA